MQKRQAHDSEPSASPLGAPATPRASGEQSRYASPEPESSTRGAGAVLEPAGAVFEAAVASEPSDTLLSAGKPADRLELLLEDRLAIVDERLREVDARLAVLERKKAAVVPESRQKPWLWIAFLIALVVVFQLLQRVR
jgi:hypothetical protein